MLWPYQHVFERDRVNDSETVLNPTKGGWPEIAQLLNVVNCCNTNLWSETLK